MFTAGSKPSTTQTNSQSNRRHSPIKGALREGTFEDTFYIAYPRPVTTLLSDCVGKQATEQDQFEKKTKTKVEKKLPSGSQRVYDYLVEQRLNYETGRLDPSISRIAKDTGFCRSTVIKILDALEYHGYIQKQRRYRRVRTETGKFRNEQVTNCYAIVIPKKFLKAVTDFLKRFKKPKFTGSKYSKIQQRLYETQRSFYDFLIHKAEQIDTLFFKPSVSLHLRPKLY